MQAPGIVIRSHSIGLLTPTAAVFEIMRVRSIDGVLVYAEQSVLDAALFPRLNDCGELPNPLYPLYQRSCGVTISNAKEQLRAVAASTVVAVFLQTVEGSPVLEVTRRSIGLTGSAVQLSRSYYLTETLHHVVTLS